MYIKDNLSSDSTMYFTQENMSNGTRMICIKGEDFDIELYCDIETAEKLSNDLLKSVKEFKEKYI